MTRKLIPRDHHGFGLTTKCHQIAKLLDAGLSDDQIVAKHHFLRNDIQTTRHMIKKRLETRAAEETPVTPNGKGGGKDQWGFYINTKRHKAALSLQATGGDVAAAVAASGLNRPNVYTVRRAMAERGRRAKLPALRNGHDLTPKANGARSPITIPMIECIVHDGNGREQPVFSSIDVFPQIYSHVLKRMGLA